MNTERTSDLFAQLETLSPEPDGFRKYQADHAGADNMSLQSYFNEYLSVHTDLSLPQIIRESNLDRNYAYQLFNGHRTHPDKYKLVSLCIAMGMSVKETDRALFLAGQPRLYPKSSLDAALILCMNQGIRSHADIMEFLLENGLSLG